MYKKKINLGVTGQEKNKQKEEILQNIIQVNFSELKITQNIDCQIEGSVKYSINEKEPN